MKTLESLKGSKFELSKDQTIEVRGGWEPAGPKPEYSIEYSNTNVGGNSYSDEEVTDICWNF